MHSIKATRISLAELCRMLNLKPEYVEGFGASITPEQYFRQMMVGDFDFFVLDATPNMLEHILEFVTTNTKENGELRYYRLHISHLLYYAQHEGFIPEATYVLITRTNDAIPEE